MGVFIVYVQIVVDVEVLNIDVQFVQFYIEMC